MSIGLGAGDGKAAVIVSADFSSGQRTLSLQDLSTKILYKIAKGNSAEEPVLGFQKKPHAVLLSHCIKCLGTQVVQRQSIGLVIDTAQGSTLTWSTARQPQASCWPTVSSGQLSLLPSMGWKMNSSLPRLSYRVKA